MSSKKQQRAYVKKSYQKHRATRLAYALEYRKQNKELLASKQSEHIKKHPKIRRNMHLKCRYGITLVEYNELLRRQNYRCPICSRTQRQAKRKFKHPLCVDHDHKTYTVRGLLCDACNNGIGRFSDNIEWLAKAIQYLRRNTL